MTQAGDQRSGGFDDAAAPIPVEPADAASARPLHLDYFAREAPERRSGRRVRLWSAVLIAGWAPYLCGIVDVLVVARSHHETVSAAHASGAAIFLTTGAFFSVAALAGFIRVRHGAGAVAASLVLLMQIAVGGCIGLAWRAP